MNKYAKNKVAGSGGVIVVLGFLLSVLFYIAIKTFYFKDSGNIIEIFSLTTSILMLAGIGLIDDLFGWWHGGMSKRLRLFLCLFAAIPLIVINAGHSGINIPLLGKMNIGLLYPLVIIPIGVIGASTTFNFLAGFNGLEAGQGIIIISALSLVAFLTGSSWLSIIGLCMVFSLLAFWFFNKTPAKVFPGDVITYAIGGLIAIMAILGDMERIAVFFFIPYIIEVILKCRGNWKKWGIQSFGIPNKDNSLESPYNGKIYGLTHFAIKALKKIKKDGKVYEKEVVLFIHLIQIFVIILGFLIFRQFIF
jgi:UDP-N-acetylglucosamine--dolichyl-phosphate N-acetylglucosaminephosphotransferase